MWHQPHGTDVCITFKSSLMRGRFIRFGPPSAFLVHKPIGTEAPHKNTKRRQQQLCHRGELQRRDPFARERKNPTQSHTRNRAKGLTGHLVEKQNPPRRCADAGHQQEEQKPQRTKEHRLHPKTNRNAGLTPPANPSSAARRRQAVFRPR